MPHSVHIFVDILPSNDGKRQAIRKASRFLSWRKRSRPALWALLLATQLVRLIGALYQ